MKKIMILCLAAGTLMVTSNAPAYSFKLFNKDKSAITQTEQKKHTFFSRKKDDSEINENKTRKLFRRSAKINTQDDEFQISSLENYVNKSIDTLISNTAVVNNETTTAFLQSAKQISTRRQYRKLNNKIKKIANKSKLTDQEKMKRIAQIEQKYADEYLNKNTIGLIASISRLSSSEQATLLRNANQLKMCHDRYLSYMQKTFEIEQTLGRLTANESTKNAINTTKQASLTINDSAKAAKSLHNSLLNLILQAGVIPY